MGKALSLRLKPEDLTSGAKIITKGFWIFLFCLTNNTCRDVRFTITRNKSRENPQS